LSDDYSWIVDLDANEEEAPALADKVVSWLVANGAVSPHMSRCVLGDEGYAPGPRLADWIGGIDGLESQIRSLSTNGLEVHPDRFVYFSYEEPDEGYQATCPAGHVQDPPETWLAAADEWQAEGRAELRCEECDKGYAITDWSIEPDFAVACLGFVFWNWVELSDGLIEGVSRVLAPHRVVAGMGAM
jgi:hypothetical protein